ncbi:hypothetical protein CC86DRAFT_407332 [Ophiobolus disseminans]|uniref:Uncharacterized protein n=1 Tax=Ophiobolus disseminans TaxID=1469910 RepID=A0A6A6ZX70_9PLEO|nr:hypothetical protein CC86DRAFT_407332 [Ophiobolus disseminans]
MKKDQSSPYGAYAPKWLLTCKAMLIEGAIQFGPNAEWTWNGYLFKESRGIMNPIWDAALDMRRITRMVLHVGNLDNFRQPQFDDKYRSEGSDHCKQLTEIAGMMRAARLSMNKVRFEGYSYNLESRPRP